MNPTVTCLLWIVDVVVFIYCVFQQVAESGLMHRFTKIIQRADIGENQTTPSDIVHSGQSHAFVSVKLVKNRGAPLMTLRDGNLFLLCSGSQDGLKCIQYPSMCRSPLFEYLGVFRAIGACC